MKATGIIRSFDDLGRIVIPKELRRNIFGTQCTDGKPMEIFVDGDSIVLKKYEENTERQMKDEFYFICKLKNGTKEYFAGECNFIDKCFDSTCMAFKNFDEVTKSEITLAVIPIDSILIIENCKK